MKIDVRLVQQFLQDGFDGLNEQFDTHHFPERELEEMSEGLATLIQNALAPQ